MLERSNNRPISVLNQYYAKQSLPVESNVSFFSTEAKEVCLIRQRSIGKYNRLCTSRYVNEERRDSAIITYQRQEQYFFFITSLHSMCCVQIGRG